MEAIVLAGGFGTRLQPVVGDRPKPMALVRGRPFLEYLFDHLLLHGVARTVLSVGYRHEAIMDHFGNRYREMEIDYSVETEPLGTGGGIRLAMWKVSGLHALVLNGDSLLRADYREMMEFHLKKKADATLALRRLPDTARYGRVTLDRTRRIKGFVEKGSESGPGLINAGVYIICKYLLMEPDFRGKFSIEKDCFGRLYNEVRLYGWPAGGYFLDIGIPEDYEKAQDEFAEFGH